MCNGRIQTEYFSGPVVVLNPHHPNHLPDFGRSKTLALINELKSISMVNENCPRALIKRVQSAQVIFTSNRSKMNLKN